METVLELVQRLSEERAAFKWYEDVVASMEGLSELFQAMLEDRVSKEEDKGIFEREEIEAKRILKEVQLADRIKDAMYEHILFVEKHPTYHLTHEAKHLLAYTAEAAYAAGKRKTSDFTVNKMKLVFEAFNNELVQRAVNYAEANKREIASDGLPVLERLNCLAILVAASSNSAAVVASALLLNESLGDMKEKYNALENTFGTEVADIVRDASKIHNLSRISREEELQNPNHMPDLILAMVADARAVMIKIAEHITLMTALDTLNPERKERFMNETLHVYIPLAERLGLNLWKSQLENLCIYPSDELKELYASVSQYDVDGIAFKDKLLDALKVKLSTSFRVESRKKSLRSILKKMDKYGLRDKTTFSEIKDIIGLRIIVKTEDECYKAKEVVIGLWEVELIKDYIKTPKSDGYKSLHTIVKNKNHHSMEVQIRTNEMHMASDDAHWVYKEGNEVPEYVKELVKFAPLVNEKETKVTGVEGNSSAHQPRCSYAKLNNPPCLDATGVCKFPSNRPMYVILKYENKATIEEYPTGTQLRILYEQRGRLQGQSKGRVLVNKVHEGLDYTLKVGDIIEFVCESFDI